MILAILAGFIIGVFIGDQIGFKRCMRRIEQYRRNGRWKLIVPRAERRRQARGQQ